MFEISLAPVNRSAMYGDANNGKQQETTMNAITVKQNGHVIATGTASHKAAHRPLSTIAREISADWGHKVNYAAKPYLEAMRGLNSINDFYYQDSAKSVVAYFLSNAATWRGDVAKRVKAELKAMIK